MKLPVIQRPEFSLYFEPIPSKGELLTFIHCDVHHKWSKSVKERLDKDFSVLMGLRESPVFAMHPKGDHKHMKFLIMYGFKYVCDSDVEPDKQFFVLEK